MGQSRRRWYPLFGLAFLVPMLFVLSFGVAQQPQPPFNERDVKGGVLAQDKKDFWVLDFRFKDPRLITVDIPGRGRRVVWYLWYQVVNYTDKERFFIPKFELQTRDKPAVYQDQVLPKAQEAIRRVEDPTSHLDIKNSVTIFSEPIPISKKADSYPRAITGVATWDDVNPDSNRYSIFVSGLSNGWSRDDNGVIRRKTLQLNFRRVGDRYNMDSREIKFEAPPVWLYRATDLSRPDEELKAKDKEKDKGAALAPLVDPLQPLRKAPGR